MNILNKLSVKAKVIVNNSVLISLLLLATGYAIFAMKNIGQELEIITKEDIPLTNVISNITIHQLAQAVHFERALRHGLEKDNTHTDKLIKHEIDKYEYYSAKIEKELKAATTLAEQGVNMNLSPELVAKFTSVKTKLVSIHESHSQYEVMTHKAFAEVKTHNVDAIATMGEEIAHLEEQLDKKLEALLLDIAKFTEKSAEHARHYEETAMSNLLWLTVFSVIVGIFFVFAMLVSVIKPLKTVVTAMQDVSDGDGDLTNRLAVIDEHELGAICSSFNRFIEQLHGIMSQVSSSSSQLGSASEELSVVTNELSENNTSAKSEIDQVATAMNEMTATVAEVANNASQVVNAVNNTNEQAGNGNTQVSNVINVIGRLAGEITNTSDAIKHLEEQSENIGVVLDVIKTISEQTNLLALNAAIEAARAGEQGRGFAVVADEVRTLAGKTQQSAYQIEEMISKLQDGAKSAVSAMGVSHEIAQKSVDEANHAGDSLKRITESIAAITDMNTQIASAAEEQTAVAEEINRNIININDTANHAAVASGQTASSSQELAKLAESLQEVVCRFKL